MTPHVKGGEKDEFDNCGTDFHYMFGQVDTWESVTKCEVSEMRIYITHSLGIPTGTGTPLWRWQTMHADARTAARALR